MNNVNASAFKELQASPSKEGRFEYEIFPRFQPIVDYKKNSVECVEALARWNHPRDGVCVPEPLIAQIDNPAFALEVDRCIYSSTVRTVSMANIGVNWPWLTALNLSSERLEDPELIGEFERSCIPPASFVIEILETTSVEHASDRALGNLEDLKSLGVQIALDDFGTGFSSVHALTTLCPDIVKIPRQFVRHIHTSLKAMDIFKSLVDISKASGARVIAEGVETKEQADIATDLGCDLLQGFYFSPPLDPSKVQDFIVRTTRMSGFSCQLRLI